MPRPNPKKWADFGQWTMDENVVLFVRRGEAYEHNLSDGGGGSRNPVATNPALDHL